jgi:ribosomal protein L3
MKIGEGHGMYLVGGTQAAMKVAAGKGKTGVSHQVGMESQISSHSDRGLHRIIGAYA